jgi:hypothetical protein
VFGDDRKHFFNAGDLFRGGTDCAVTLFGVKIFGRQGCWHNDNLVTGISLSATYSANVKENRKESQLLHDGYGYRCPCPSHKVDFETAKSYIYTLLLCPAKGRISWQGLEVVSKPHLRPNGFSRHDMIEGRRPYS